MDLVPPRTQPSVNAIFWKYSHAGLISGLLNFSSPLTHLSSLSGPAIARTRSSIQSVTRQPVAAPDSAAMHHGVLPSDLIFALRASSSSRVRGLVYPALVNDGASVQMMLLTLTSFGRPYTLPSAQVPACEKPGTSVSLAVVTVASSYGTSLPCLARSHIRPGCGNSPTSGGLPPWTRVRISVSHDAAFVNFTVMPFFAAQADTSALKPGSVSGPSPYMTSTVDLPGPLAVPALVLPPVFPDRHPDARPATAMPISAVRPALC